MQQAMSMSDFVHSFTMSKHASLATSPANGQCCSTPRRLSHNAVQATLTADVTYFFVVDGYNGAYGTWQFSLEALDNSTVEGSLLSGPYGLAVAGTSSTTTNSKHRYS